MIAETPYQLFTPIHPAWLHRCHEQQLDVTAADLDSIEANFPDARADPLFAEYRSRADAGKLHRKRGRKPLSLAGRFRLWAAFFQIEEERIRIRNERQTGKRLRQPFEESPIHQAAEIVARRFRLGSGRSLLNRLSREGIPKNY